MLGRVLFHPGLQASECRTDPRRKQVPVRREGAGSPVPLTAPTFRIRAPAGWAGAQRRCEGTVAPSVPPQPLLQLERPRPVPFDLPPRLLELPRFLGVVIVVVGGLFYVVVAGGQMLRDQSEERVLLSQLAEDCGGVRRVFALVRAEQT